MDSEVVCLMVYQIIRGFGMIAYHMSKLLEFWKTSAISRETSELRPVMINKSSGLYFEST